MTVKTHYLNTDLDLEAAFDLTPLAEQMVERGLVVLHVHQWDNGQWTARFETNEWFEAPDPNIAAMLTAVETLGEPARSLWAACTTRTFDVGYECGEEPWRSIRSLPRKQSPGSPGPVRPL